MNLVGLEGISHEYPNRVVLADVTIGVHAGDRIGVVGRNGDGKSTLLSIIGGTLIPDNGRVTVRGGTRIGTLTQDDEFDDSATVAQTVVGDGPEHEWAGNPVIRAVLAGLLSDVDVSATIGSLSGGQRRRTALARLLVGEWDVLLLDEPTNHLDVSGVSWLAEHLNRRWKSSDGALVVVTHDRWFLDAISTETWEVHDGTVDRFEGGYAAYILQRVERQRQAAAIEDKRQNLLRKELAWLRRGAPARTSKPKFRIDAATELIADVPPPRDRVELAKMATQRLGKDVVDLVDVDFAIAGTTILEDVEWRIAPGERTGILGRNGAGKSTLLGLIDGSLTATAGRVKRGKTVHLRRLDQRLEGLDEVMDDKVRDIIGRLKTNYNAGGVELTPGQLLERLGFSSAHLSTPVRDLSGGQKRRLQILLILLDEPNVLLLDEPTNDLDTDMLAALEDVLDSWPGTLIVVSHDRYLLERVTDNQYAVIGHHLRHLPGGVDEYLRLDARIAEPVVAAKAAPAPTALSGAEKHALEKEVKSLDRQIENTRQTVNGIHDELAVHDQSDYEGLTSLSTRLREANFALEELESKWLNAMEKLES
ncbi:MAG: ABC-F family ATP-binding cassette domain-containing protein [Microbacteriaceae bacterium]